MRWLAGLACVLLLAGCGEAAGAGGGQAPSTEKAAAVGEEVNVGPLRVTLTDTWELGDRTSGDVYFTAGNGHFFAVKLRLENTGQGVLTEFPTAQVVGADGQAWEAVTMSEPTPSLSDDLFDFKLPPGASKEGWVTFDMAGPPAKLYVYMTSDGAEPATGTWTLPSQ